MHNFLVCIARMLDQASKELGNAAKLIAAESVPRRNAKLRKMSKNLALLAEDVRKNEELCAEITQAYSLMMIYAKEVMDLGTQFTNDPGPPERDVGVI